MRRSDSLAVVAGRGAILLALLASPGAATTQEAEAASFRAASEALDAALKSSDAEGLLARTAEEVVLFPPGEAPVHGKAAFRAWWDGLMSTYHTVSLELTEVERQVSGDLGVLHGKHVWTMAPNAGGDPFTETGHYFQIWKREADGRWLLEREIWNSSAPPAAGEGAR